MVISKQTNKFIKHKTSTSLYLAGMQAKTTCYKMWKPLDAFWWMLKGSPPIICSAPKSSSHHFIFHWKCISFELYLSNLSSIQTTDGSHPQKSSYSEPNYSSCWWSFVVVVVIACLMSNLIHCIPGCKQTQGITEVMGSNPIGAS